MSPNVAFLSPSVFLGPTDRRLPRQVRHAHPTCTPHRLRPRPCIHACQRADRETDARGFVLPQAGDVVLYQGRWPGEDEAGLVESVRFVASRSAHIVDVAPLRRISLDLFAVPRARNSRVRWFDVGEVRVVPDAAYVPRQDAYRVSGTNDGYAPVRVPSPDERAKSDAEYRALQSSMLRVSATAVAVGSVLPLFVGRIDLAGAFAAGGTASLVYLLMLQRAVDAVATEVPRALRVLLPLRFAVPILPFLAEAVLHLPPHATPAMLLGSISKDEALATVLGLLMYKVPLLASTASEFVDGLADIELGKTGMVGTAAALAAREVRKRRDGTTDDEETTANMKRVQPVMVFVGPSGVGKSTLMHKLMEDMPERFAYSVSHTTRERRDGEQDGLDYNFVAVEKFEQMVEDGQFIEHACVHGRYYGTSVQAVDQVLADGRICLLDLDVQGVEALREKTDLEWDARYVWIGPPSLDVLAERLRQRGTETEETLKTRLNSAMREMTYAATNNVFDIIVINDELERAYGELTTYVEKETAGWQKN